MWNEKAMTAFIGRKIDFPNVRNVSDLTKYLFTSPPYFRQYANDLDQRKFYKRMLIPKKNSRSAKKFRVVYKAEIMLGMMHKQIETSIRLAHQFPDCVQGFTEHRSIGTNARHHLAHKYILNADIKDFFDSIEIDRVIDAFVRLGANKKVAAKLAAICTINGVLRQGLSASPILANIVCEYLDEELIVLSKKYGCRYTRYGDDITMSSDKDLPSTKEIEGVLKKYDFRLNKEKFSVKKRGQGQYVTGLTVFDHERPRIPKNIKREIRLILHFVSRYGIKNHFKKRKISFDYDNVKDFRNKMWGWLYFINSIEPDFTERYLKIWANILLKDRDIDTVI